MALEVPDSQRLDSLAPLSLQVNLQTQNQTSFSLYRHLIDFTTAQEPACSCKETSSLTLLDLVTVREDSVSPCTCLHKSPQDSPDALCNHLEHLDRSGSLEGIFKSPNQYYTGYLRGNRLDRRLWFWFMEMCHRGRVVSALCSAATNRATSYNGFYMLQFETWFTRLLLFIASNKLHQ